MSVGPWWKILLAIAVGSVAGALLRQGVIRLFAGSRNSRSGVMLAASALLGGLVGAAMGGVMAGPVLTSENQSALFIALAAALGTFGVGAVLAMQPLSHEAAPRAWRTAVVHLALALLAAVVGMMLIYWFLGLNDARA